MKKVLTGLFSFVLALFICNSVQAMTLAWDSYTDPTATGLRIESSTNNVDFTTIVDDITTDNIASEVPDGPDNTRVYYRMKAFNSTESSTPSNMVSFFWTTGGGGYSGLPPIDNIRLLDCDTILTDPSNPNYALCEGRHIP
jgi:hypothetical protein